MTFTGPCKMNWGQKEQDWQLSKSSLRERFRELLQLSQWTDCTFIVGEECIEIKCHKLVLAVSSPVFEALFFGCLSNSSDEPIRIPDIEPHIFRMLLMYMYSDSLNLRSVEDAGGLLYSAKKYLMPQLSRLCLDYLLDRTCIQTLWDVLAIAEALDEEELILAALKVMCRFGPHVWYNKVENLSASMLKRLLSESCMNMTEEELWAVTLDWAQKDCLRRGVIFSGKHIRDALERERLLERVRFLVFNRENFRNTVVKTEVLTKSEADIVFRVIDASEYEQMGINPDLCSLEENSNHSYEIPVGLCPLRKKRRLINRLFWRCTRERIKGDTIWLCCDQFICTVTTRNLVLITGLEVPTRCIYSARECYPRPGSLQQSTGTYNERFNVVIRDENGKILATTFRDALVPYDSTQVVTLDEEVWFKPNQNYFIVFELSSGSYELYNLARSVQSKGTVFTFKDSSDHARSDIFCGSFVISMLYCL